jgi:uncharacterized protein (DUF2062 family)
VIYQEIIGADESPMVKAFSVALGVFMGIAPFWGAQMLIAFAIAWLFRLNKAITLIASNISLPPMIPFLLWGSYEMGKLLIGNVFVGTNYTNYTYVVFIHDWLVGVINSFQIKDTDLANSIIANISQYVVGSFALGAVAGAIAGISTYIVVKVVKK